MILRRIAIYHVQYYIQKVIIPDILLNPDFYEEMLIGKQLINEVIRMDKQKEIHIHWLIRILLKIYKRKTKWDFSFPP